jgi:Beta-propeller repeat
LIIDPVLMFAYSTYLGGAGGDEGYSIAVDAAGQAYVTGWTYSPDFPTSLGPFDSTHNGGTDAFITKLSANGSALVYSTYLGGAPYGDVGNSIAVDAAGQAYVTGWTYSPDFPTTPDALDPTFNSMFAKAFITKLSTDGSALVYSTYLGGSYGDAGYSIAVDASLNLYVAGQTISPDFPTTPGAFDATQNGGWDTFITKLNAAGHALVYSTFLGGRELDYGFSMAVDAVGQAYVTGYTLSPDFPTTLGAFDRTCGTDGNCNPIEGYTSSDALITKLDASGRALVYSTYLGGQFSEEGTSIAVDAAGQAYILGNTMSDDFPITPGALDETRNDCPLLDFINCYEPFTTKLDAAGSALVYSTYLGPFTTRGYGIALDAARNVYVTGGTFDDVTLLTTPGALDPTYNGEGDAFVSKISEMAQ